MEGKEEVSMEKVLEVLDLEGLRRHHERLKARLAVLERHLSLTTAEQDERVRLKKEKLLVKDRILVLTSAP
jgi:hypothetical protein